jgi:hypothetical protein
MIFIIFTVKQKAKLRGFPYRANRRAEIFNEPAGRGDETGLSVDQLIS